MKLGVKKYSVERCKSRFVQIDFCEVKEEVGRNYK